MLRSVEKLGWSTVILCLCCMSAEQAWCTVIPSLTMEQMIHRSSRIVRGKVIQKHFLWGPKHRYIYTEIRVRVLEQMKGETLPVVVVRKLGGILDGIESKVPGTANYQLQEEVVLFLEKKRLGRYYFVMGLAAGKYSVLRGSGQILLKRSAHGLTFHRPLGHKKTGSSLYHLNYTETPLSLLRLRQSIRLYKRGRTALPPTPSHPKTKLPSTKTKLPSTKTKLPSTKTKLPSTKTKRPLLRALPLNSRTVSKGKRILQFLRRIRRLRSRNSGFVVGPVLQKKSGFVVGPVLQKKPGFVVGRSLRKKSNIRLPGRVLLKQRKVSSKKGGAKR